MHELRQEYPVVKLLKIVELAKSSFYYWDQARQAPDKYERIKQRIKKIYERHRGRYGYRRIACVLQSEGEVLHRNTVARLMGVLGLKSTQRPKRYRSYRGEVGRVAPNEMNRDFNAQRPNEKWVTDVTEFKVGNEKLFLSPVKDLYNGEIVAYTMGARPTLELVSSMMKKALRVLGVNDQPMLHSDQGWQYQMPSYRKMLEDRNLVQSMSRKGNCHDNASMESFFAVLKSECFYTNKFTSIDALKKEVADYIRYYNNERIRVSLDGLSPVQYRFKHTKAT